VLWRDDPGSQGRRGGGKVQGKEKGASKGEGCDEGNGVCETCDCMMGGGREAQVPVRTGLQLRMCMELPHLKYICDVSDAQPMY
jgi:hypothetical protein